MHNQQLNNPFWTYACELYQNPDLQAILLRLQDEHCLNINILLCMVWLGENRVLITDKPLTSLVDCIEDINSNVVQPLRQARRYLKTDGSLPTNCYESVRQMELDIEKILIQKLFDNSRILLQDIVNHSCVEHNIELYIKSYNTTNPGGLEPQKEALLKVLLE